MLVLVIVPMLILPALHAALPEAPRTFGVAGPASPPFLALAQPVRALAAAGAAVVALTDRGDVLVFDLAGRVRRRIAATAVTTSFSGGRTRRARGAAGQDGFAIGAGVLEDGDFNDPHDVDSDVEDPENVWPDEGGRPPPGPRAPAIGVAPTVVAAGGQSIWIAGPGGLSRLDADDGDGESVTGQEAARIAPVVGGVWEALSASTDGRWVVGVRDGWLVRSGDGGETFAPLGLPVVTPRRLAISDDGTVFLIERPELNGGRPSTEERTEVVSLSSGEATDVATCGRRALVLEGGRILVLGPDAPGAVSIASGGRPATTGAPAPDEALRLACSADGERLLAYGPELWTRDQGPGPGQAQGQGGWSRRDDLPPVPILTAVVAGDSVWAATAAGVWVLSVAAPVDAGAPSGAEGPAAPLPALLPEGALDPPAPASRVEWGWWTAVLPRIDLEIASARASDRRDLRAFVLFTFLLDGERGWARERHRLALEDARLRRTSLGLFASLAHPTVPSSDPIDREERAALAHVLETKP